MKLASFNATNVFGYLGFNIQFNKDINFLIGVNGSGKTTAIKLINALLTSNTSELSLTYFESIELKIEDIQGGSDCFAHISCKNNLKKRTKTLTYSDKNNEKVSAEIPDFSVRSSEDEIIQDRMYIEHRLERKLNHQYRQKIESLDNPIFLGIKRTNLDTNSYRRNRYISHEESIFSNDMINPGKEYINYVYKLVSSFIEKYLQFEKNTLNDLKLDIISQSFKYLDNVDLNQLQQINLDILNSNDFANTLEKLDIKQKDITSTIKKFEEATKDVSKYLPTNKIDEKKLPKMLEVIANIFQLDRISKNFKAIQDNADKLKAEYAPMTSFITTMNKFFSDSSKEIQVDALGTISVISEKKKHL